MFVFRIDKFFGETYIYLNHMYRTQKGVGTKIGFYDYDTTFRKNLF